MDLLLQCLLALVFAPVPGMLLGWLGYTVWKWWGEK